MGFAVYDCSGSSSMCRVLIWCVCPVVRPKVSWSTPTHILLWEIQASVSKASMPACWYQSKHCGASVCTCIMNVWWCKMPFESTRHNLAPLSVAQRLHTQASQAIPSHHGNTKMQKCHQYSRPTLTAVRDSVVPSPLCVSFAILLQSIASFKNCAEVLAYLSKQHCKNRVSGSSSRGYRTSMIISEYIQRKHTWMFNRW